MPKEFFSLFSNCIVTYGALNATIADLQYGNIYNFPKGIIKILDELKSVKKSDYDKKFDTKSLKVLYEYISFLERHSLGFWSDCPDYFPPLNKKWKSPSKITNSIIEVNEKTKLNLLKNIINQLSECNCKSIEIRFISKKELNISQLAEVLNLTVNSTIKHIQIIIRSFEINEKCNWNTIFKKFPRLYDVYLFNSDRDDNISLNQKNTIIYRKRDFLHTNCGGINKNFFSVNIKSFTESINHNSCLNCKISFSPIGEIKNCPSMKKGFGNINENKIEIVIKNKNFNKLWSINKDKIDVCKDCEYRYVCTDCRAFIEEPKNEYSKPLKCGYNPYKGEWSEWSLNPFKQKAINYYNK